MEYVVICDNCGTESQRGVNVSQGWFTLNGPLGATLYFDKWECVIAYSNAHETPVQVAPAPVVPVSST